VFGMADQTYAELCAVKATSLEKIPERLDVVDAAALPLITTTGNQLVTLGAEVQVGQTVLITGAVGNVGRSAVFTAKALGAAVIAGVLESWRRHLAWVQIKCSQPTTMMRWRFCRRSMPLPTQ
jgi:NADPH:quinone reductase-like Zn-dependent oxidoreductase